MFRFGDRRKAVNVRYFNVIFTVMLSSLSVMCHLFAWDRDVTKDLVGVSIVRKQKPFYATTDIQCTEELKGSETEILNLNILMRKKIYPFISLVNVF
jgi:hypothetical protein